MKDNPTPQGEERQNWLPRPWRRLNAEVTRRGLDRHEQDDSIPSEVVEENLKKAA